MLKLWRSSGAVSCVLCHGNMGQLLLAEQIVLQGEHSVQGFASLLSFLSRGNKGTSKV